MNEGHNSTGNLQKRALKKTLGGLSVLSAELAALAGQAISLRGQIDHIERGLEDEEHSDGRELTALYSAMGRVLPEIVGKTFEQVAAFHQSVIANRRVHLADHLVSLRARLEETLSEAERVETRRNLLLHTV